MDHLTLTTLL